MLHNFIISPYYSAFGQLEQASYLMPQLPRKESEYSLPLRLSR